MRLPELPVEIISRICRHIGVTFEESIWHEDGWAVKYQNKDFQALRLACKEIYHKTGYDAAARYSLILEEIEVLSSRSSLTQLSRLASQPAMRDRIHKIYLLDAAITADPPAEERAQVEEFQTSDQAVELLAECFRNVETGKRLERIEPIHDSMVDLMLRAMSLCNFARRLAILPLCPNHLARVGYPCLAETPQAYLPYIKIIQIQPFLSYGPNVRGDYDAEDENIYGYHIKDYRSTSPEYTKLITIFSNVDRLDYYGCRSHPALKFCHGCDDLFANTFAAACFPCLRKFTVSAAFISGGRLRAFIKKHANSLIAIDISSVNLTDGSWRSIAQGLSKLPHLEKLSLCDLRQKHKATFGNRPTAYCSANTIFLDKKDNISTSSLCSSRALARYNI
ncbi:hypothetical protein BDU57DRAFT_530934 [Ampelomyces quisqualis]|uniref:Uncharacterized protein n=1 Tax=Ampelomyces quisqualis TaxID=50730 RepID=A0A6A5QFJ0_AMPQU|nr:hypothetical protein BDU57DRAFT_530934 [Ampelomyces quisqualis]